MTMPRKLEQDLLALHHNSLFDYQDLAVLREIASNTKGSKKLLDLGCASGRVLIEAKKAGFITAGIDLSPSMISAAKQQTPFAKLYRRDMTKRYYSFKSKFDVVTLVGNTFQMILDPASRQRVIDNASFYLKKGGIFYFWVRSNARTNTTRDIKVKGFHGKKVRLQLTQKDELKNRIRNFNLKITDGGRQAEYNFKTKICTRNEIERCLKKIWP